MKDNIDTLSSWVSLGGSRTCRSSILLLSLGLSLRTRQARSTRAERGKDLKRGIISAESNTKPSKKCREASEIVRVNVNQIVENLSV